LTYAHNRGSNRDPDLQVPHPDLGGFRGPQQQVPALHLQFRTVSEDKGRHDDDFAGISRMGAAFLVTVAALAHPWQTLKELLPVVRRLGRLGLEAALKLPLVLFVLVRVRLWSRRNQGPTFEDYLHGFGEDRDRP
jgi:hypothetical protein